MSKRETVRRDVIAQRAATEMEVKDSPRSSSNDMDAIPTNTSIAKPAVDDAAMLSDPFSCRMRNFQCTECIGDEQLLCEDRTFFYTRASSRNNHFDLFRAAAAATTWTSYKPIGKEAQNGWGTHRSQHRGNFELFSPPASSAPRR
ncbi:MAG: hypothetical protein Q9173_005750 [Seirophora scorigena]